MLEIAVSSSIGHRNRGNNESITTLHCDRLIATLNLKKTHSVLARLNGQVILVLYIVQIQEHTMRVVNFSDARNRLKSVLDQVVDDSDCTIISRRDAEDAVVMSLDHFNALMETVHLLGNPANAAHLAKSIAQYRSGEIEKHELVDD
jgi:antitoxin YefM